MTAKFWHIKFSAKRHGGSPAELRRRGLPVRPLAHLKGVGVTTMALLAGLLLSTGDTSTAVAASKSSTINFGYNFSFTGSLAGVGQQFRPFIEAACNQINAAGGILGKTCKEVDIDDRSDPADAVINLRQAYASKGPIPCMVGFVTLTASATVPIVVRSNSVAFNSSGSSEFTQPVHFFGSRAKYIYMSQPPDAMVGYSLALAARKLGFTRPAFVFTSSADEVPVVAGVKTASAAIGLHPAISLTLAAGQASYGTVVARVLAAHPDAILTELDPATAGTFFSNLVTASGGLKVPFVGDNISTTTSWYTAVKAALGAKTIMSKGYIVDTQAAAPGPGLTVLKNAFNALHSSSSFAADLSFGAPMYDNMTQCALAMLQTKSTNPAVFEPAIARISGINGAEPGAVIVHSFAKGKLAIEKGKNILYLGASGKFDWNANHVLLQNFVIAHYTFSGGGLAPGKSVAVISTKDLTKALG